MNRAFHGPAWSAVVCALLIVIAAGIDAVPAQGACLTGIVTDGSGTPIGDVDLDFFNAVSGEKLVTPGDNTDATGFYNVCVLPGVYHVAFDPPPGTHYLGKRIFAVDLSTAKELNIVLDLGVVVSGVIHDSAGTPVGGADLDADSVGAGRVYTPNDVSDPLTGQYWLVVPPGTYRIHYDSPPGTRYRGVELDSVPVTSDTTIDILMSVGRLLSGRVSNEIGVGITQVSVDLRVDSTGAKVFVSNNETDSLGNYQVAVPDGVFELRFSPRPGSRYVAALVDSFSIAADQAWNQTLVEGWVVRFVVHDTSGAAIADVDIDFKQISTGVKLFTPRDNTDDSGKAILTVPPDLYQIILEPPVGSVYDRRVLDSVDIQSDTVLSVLLPEVQRVAFVGQVKESTGTGVSNVELKFVSEPTGKSVYVPASMTTFAGDFALQVPIGTYEVQFLPPPGSRLVASRMRGVSVQADTTIGVVVLESGVLVDGWVIDTQGEPLADADFDFIRIIDSTETFTPADNTGADGHMQVVVGVGSYSLIVTPAPGSPVRPVRLDNVVIERDTSLTIIIADPAGISPVDLTLDQNFPNPFNAGTTIRYAVLKPSQVSLSIYNVLGQLVRVLSDEYHPVGIYERFWDGRNASGRPAASGLYLYRLKSPQRAMSRRLLLIK